MVVKAIKNQSLIIVFLISVTNGQLLDLNIKLTRMVLTKEAIAAKPHKPFDYYFKFRQ